MRDRLVASTVVFTRLPVLLAGIIAVTVVGTTPPPAAEALWRVSSNEIANLLARWDSAFYYSIATSGYQWDPNTFSHQNVVFFPLYPLLMRWGGVVLGGRKKGKHSGRCRRGDKAVAKNSQIQEGGA